MILIIIMIIIHYDFAMSTPLLSYYSMAKNSANLESDLFVVSKPTNLTTKCEKSTCPDNV